MRYARKLLRGIDFDLVERIEASGKIERRPKAKSGKTPRHSSTYRQNGAIAKPLVKDRSFKGPIRLNTTRNRPSQYAVNS